MAKQLKLRRGTTSQHSSFTGAEGECTVDTTKDTLVVHDGSQAGGRPLLREDLNNIGTGVITATMLSSNSVSHAKLTADCIDGTNIQDDVINTEHYTANSINATALTSDSVTTTKIEDDAVTTAKINADAVTAAKIAVNAVGASELAPNAVYTAAIATDAVTQAKIADDAIDEVRLQVSNTPTNGYVLTAQSGNTGGLTWAEQSAAGATGGGSDTVFWENGQTVTTNYTITNNTNAGSFGPITINSGITVTVGADETWTVI